MRIVIDVNIWISFCIGNKMVELRSVVDSKLVELIVSLELFDEFLRVTHRPKLQKYISENRIKETIDLMGTFTTILPISNIQADFIDPKDNYLLDLSFEAKAEYLITGDRALLNLKNYHETSIISFRDFIILFFNTSDAG